ncbi:MAG TPA: hypothetical protein VK673_20890 [Chthoniobacterales bacterium]|jgi:hypothetical protein|nr:hypothetical protein [Chthoniobacterales bacterium]
METNQSSSASVPVVLKTRAFVREAGRGLLVVPLDPKLFEAIYVY